MVVLGFVFVVYFYCWLLGVLAAGVMMLMLMWVVFLLVPGFSAGWLSSDLFSHFLGGGMVIHG